MRNQKAFIKISKGTYVTTDERFMIQHNDKWQFYKRVDDKKYETMFGYAETLANAKDYILCRWYDTTLWSVQHLDMPRIQYNGKPIDLI